MLALVFEACAPFGARWWCPCCTRGLLWAIVAVACMSPSALMASPDASTNVSSEDVKARCERAADKWFKKNYPLPEEQTSVGSGKATYTSHFSATRNDCFMEAVETAHIRQDGETQIVDSEIHQLIDLKTGEQIGQLVISRTTLGYFGAKWRRSSVGTSKSGTLWSAYT